MMTQVRTFLTLRISNPQCAVVATFNFRKSDGAEGVDFFTLITQGSVTFSYLLSSKAYIFFRWLDRDPSSGLPASPGECYSRPSWSLDG